MQLIAVMMITPPDEQELQESAPMVATNLEEEEIIYQSERWVAGIFKGVWLFTECLNLIISHYDWTKKYSYLIIKILIIDILM